MSSNRRPTMKDVAKHAKVSVSTVSYVLNNNGPVADDRRARILESMRVLHYEPNESARNLKRRSASAIGLVVPDLGNQFFALLAKGVERAASLQDVLVVLCNPETSEEAELSNARLLRSQRVDGVVYLTGFDESPASLIELTKIGPVVLVDERVPGLNLPSVLSEARRGAREIASHVFDNGHKNVAVISGPTALWTSEQRLAGYREACAGAGLDPDKLKVVAGDYRMHSGAILAEKLLSVSKAKRPTALLCANDLMAIGAMEYCKSAGLSVPEDVSIVGFDDIPIAGLLTPRLSTVRQPAEEMGFQAATLLINMIKVARGEEGVEKLPSQTLVPVEVVIRDSVCPPSKAK